MDRPGDPSVIAGPVRFASDRSAPPWSGLPTLDGRRLALRTFRTEDVDALVALDRDPAVRRFVDDGGPATTEAARAAIRAWHEHSAQRPGFGCWAATDRRTGDFVGWFHLFDRDAVGRCELGFRLVRSAWGQGLATEGSLVLVDHAFRATQATTVFGEAMAIHVASRRVMEKCGMTLVATFRAEWPVRIPGDEFGDVRYELDRHAWLTG